MRLCVRLWSEKEQRVPLSHLDLLRDVLDTIREVDGVPLSFSDLRVPAKQRRIDRATGELVVAPGTVQWWLASPSDDSLSRLAARFASGKTLMVGESAFQCRESVAHFFPSFAVSEMPAVTLRFSCRTPIVVAETLTRPESYEPLIRQALLNTYAHVYRRVPDSGTVSFAFDADYLRSHPRGGTKRIDFRGDAVNGILAPFLLTASPQLLRLAWECGVGERTEDGFGFAELTDT